MIRTTLFVALSCVACGQHVESAPAQCPPASSASSASPVASNEPAPVSDKFPSPVPPEMAQLDYFVGVWTCDVDAQAMGPVPAHKYQGTITEKKDLGGHWHSIRNTSQYATVAGYAGYDTVDKQFLRISVTSRGSTERKVTDGWHGDEWIMVGTSSNAGKQQELRHTITKHGENEFLGKYEVRDAGGEWKLQRQELCKK